MEVINSFLTNVKEKFTNPFFGTLIFVLCVENWELLYKIFNFDKGTTLDNKLHIINEYINNRNYIGIIFYSFFKSLLLVLIGYFFIIISRTVMNFVYKIIIPYLDEKISSKHYVPMNKYKEVEENMNNFLSKKTLLETEKVTYENEIENLRKEKNIIQNKYKDLEIISKVNENKLNEINSSNIDLSAENTGFKSKLTELENQLIEKNKDLDDKTKIIEKYKVDNINLILGDKFIFDNFKSNLEYDNESEEIVIKLTVPIKVKEAILVLNNNSAFIDFINIANKIKLNEEIIFPEPTINILINTGLITRTTSSNNYKPNKKISYELTSLGNQVFNTSKFLNKP